MRRALAGFALIGTAVCTAPCVAGAASFTLLDTFSTTDVTVDQFGRTLVLTGGSFFGAGAQYIYDVDASAYNYIGDGTARTISADGSAVAGKSSFDGQTRAARWTESGGWEALGNLGATGGGTCQESSAYSVTADGSTVIGFGWEDVCSARAFKWTAETGMVGMEMLGNGTNRASVISDDGQVIAGFAQGSFSRTPAVWNADGSGWLFDIDAQGEIGAMSPDGTVLAGQYYDENTGGFHYLAFYWTEQTGVVYIPSLPDFPGGYINGVSESGRTFVGLSGTLLEGRIAMIARPEWGSVALKDKLIELGVTNIGDAYLEGMSAVSDDGTIVTGWAILPPTETDPGSIQGFIATLPEEAPVLCNEDLDGDGQVGFTDLTQLLGTWGPCPACPEDLDGDGQVGFTDLTQLLGNWGPCV